MDIYRYWSSGGKQQVPEISVDAGESGDAGDAVAHRREEGQRVAERLPPRQQPRHQDHRS